MISALGDIVCRDLECSLMRFMGETQDLSLIACFDRITRNTPEAIGADAALDLSKRLYVADLSKSERCAKLARMMQDEFIKTFPNSFPKVLLKVGESSIEIPQFKLTLQSRMFDKMFSISLQESLTKRVELHPVNNPSNGAIGSFLRFLQDGTVEMTEQNWLDLFLLAEENDMPSLSLSCIKYARRFIHKGVLKEWLELATFRNSSILKYICLEFITKNEVDLQDIPVTGQPEIEKIVTTAMALRKSSVVLGIHEIGSITFKNIGFIRDTKKLELIQKIHAEIPFHTIEVKSTACTDEHLKALATFIKEPENLILSQTNVIKIPEIWLNSLKTIKAEKCQCLLSIISETVNEIEVRLCDLVAEVDTPNARKIKIQICPKLASLSAQSAFIFECTDNECMTEIIALEAVIINVCNNKKLVKLIIPKAQKISLDRNPLLKTLDAPNGLLLHSLLGNECLESIDAPQAVQVHLGLKSELKSLTVSEECKVNSIPEGCEIRRVPQTLPKELVNFNVMSLKLNGQ